MRISLQRRLHQLTGQLRRMDGVEAILCFGSVASGTADSFSDIDLYILCTPRIPSQRVRSECFGQMEKVDDMQIGVVSSWDGPWNRSQDKVRVDGVWIDVSYNTLSWVTRVVRQVVDQGATTMEEMPFRPYTLCGLIDRSLILVDKTRSVQGLKKLMRPYPRGLQKNLFEKEGLRLKESWEDLNDYTKRNIGNSAFLFQLQAFLDSLVTLLFALNGKYDPASKRRELDVEGLDILPQRFGQRYRKILEGPFTFRARRALLNELSEFKRFVDEKWAVL